MNIHIELEQRPYGIALVRALLASGWTADNSYGSIHYAVPDADDDLNAAFEKVENLEAVLQTLADVERGGQTFTISLFWLGTDHGVLLVNNPTKNVFTLGYDGTRRVLPAAPPITDHNWYLDRILPPLIDQGAVVRSIVWRESP